MSINRFNEFGIPNDLAMIRNKEHFPGDTISRISWYKKQDSYVFACTSWDGTLRVYECMSLNIAPYINQVASFSFDAPLTSFCWVKEMHFFIVGTADGRVIFFDAQQKTQKLLNRHNFGIREVFFDEENEMVISVDCETSIKFTSFTTGESKVINVQFKISCVDYKDRFLALGLSHNKVCVISLKDINCDPIYANSPSESYIHSIKFGDSPTECILGTTDGRIAMARIEPVGTYRSKTYDFKSVLIFKGHKDPPEKDARDAALFPVNDLIFTKRHGYILGISCAANRKVAMWSLNNKQKFREFTLPGVVTNIDMHPQKDLVLAATGYDWHEGVWGLSKVDYTPGIYIYAYKDDDFRNFELTI